MVMVEKSFINARLMKLNRGMMTIARGVE